jgi:hypothetical protein
VKIESTGGFLRASRAIIAGALALGALRAGAQGKISGVVYDSLRTHAPLANATVVLVESSRYTTTDNKGRFSFDSVAAGQYTIGFTHDVLDSLDLQSPVVAAAVGERQRLSLTLAVPSAATMYARLCPSVHDTSTGMVIGRVRDVDDQTALKDAAVSTDWTEFVVNGNRPGSARMRAATKSNAGGIYLLCGVPTRVPLEVRTELGDIVVGPTPLQMNGRLFARVDFAISRKDGAARELRFGATHADSVTFAARSPGTATLRGVVRGADGNPLHDVIVSVMGAERSGRSDAAGVFHIEQIPAGTRTMEAKSIGMLPVTFSMDFPTLGTRDTTISITQQAQQLKAVAVTGRNPALSLMENGGFEERRKHGLGYFVTEADVKKHNFPNLSDVLTNVGSIRMQHGKLGKDLPMMLGQASMQSVYCIPNFWVDNTPYHVDGAEYAPSVHFPFADIASMVRPENVKGIEIYSTPGTVPAQYDKFSSTGCGSVVIWTR